MLSKEEPEDPDSLFWELDPSGYSTVKSGYHWKCQQFPQPSSLTENQWLDTWKIVWSVDLPLGFKFSSGDFVIMHAEPSLSSLREDVA